MSDFEVIPQQAIDALLADPNKAAGFDQVFGAGRAQEVLRSNNSVGDQEVAPQERPSIVSETLRAVVGGPLDAIEETGEFIQSTGEGLGRRLTGNRDVYFTPNGFEFLDVDEAQAREDIPSWQKTNLLGDGGLIDLPDVADNETFVGGMGRGAAQFMTGFFAAGGLTRFKGFWGAMANGAIADAVVFDPKDPNLMATLDEFGIDAGPITDALATDPEDPEYINRLRNAAEGTALGLMVEAIGWGVRARVARKNGNSSMAEEAAKKEAEVLAQIEGGISNIGKAVDEDNARTLDLKKNVLDFLEDTDGQLRMDLGDTPSPRTADTPTGPIRVTPEVAEKARLQARLAAGEPTARKASIVSFRSLNTFENLGEAGDILAGQRAVMADEFAKIKGGDVQRWETVQRQTAANLREMASMFGEDPEALVRRFMSGGPSDPARLAAEVQSRTQVMRQVNEDLSRMADAISKGEFRPEEFPGIRNIDHLRLAFEQRMAIASQLSAGTDALRSNIGRALNAMKMANQDSRSLQRVLKQSGNGRNVDAAVRAIMDPENVGKPAVRVARDAANSIKGFIDDVNSYRINALLSGPGTQEVNTISNLLNGVLLPVEQVIGGAGRGDLKSARHGLQTLRGMLTGSLEATRTAFRSGWYEEAILDPFHGKIEEDNIGRAKTRAGFIFNNKVTRLPSRALLTMDEFFKQAQYRGRILADADMLAREQGLRGDEKSEFMQRYIRESFDENGAGIREDALLQAQRTTFTEPLTDELSLFIQRLAIKSPLVRFIVPFVRTPLNILSQTVQHAPVVGAISRRWREDVAAGGPRAAQAWGKWMVSTGVIISVASLVAQGRITGSGPTDPRIRKVWLKNNQPYAIRVDNEDGTVTWHSYQRLEPIANILSITADMSELANDPYNEVDSDTVIAGLFMAVMENTVNKTFTQGIHDFMQMLVGRPHEQEAAWKNAVTSFIPNVFNQLNGDEALRETRTLADAAMARVHLYGQVDPKRNVLGEPVIRQLPKYDPLGFTDADIREVDPVMGEITRVAITNQTVAGNPSRTISGPNQIDLSEIPYSDSQTLYDRWLELTGEIKIGGKTLREKLLQTIESRSYQRLPDGFEGATGPTKAKAIRRVISSYREKAKSELPELQEIIRAEKQGTAALLRQQSRANRELFPVSERPRGQRPRTFEDLLNQN